ncbi:MAG TPA: hypothetical protein VKT80_09495, partial [Chloroflexota bacterium]|nr:hypothetical protein [Chloroflexota bacterium]
LVAALRDRVLFADSANWGQPIRYPGVWWLAAFISAALFAWRTIAARRIGTPRAAIALTGFGITLLLFLSRGFSPQFTLWVLPFIVLFLPGVDGAVIAVVLMFNNLVLEAYLYVTLFHGTDWLLYVDVTMRTVIFLWLLVEFGAAIDESALRRWHGLRRRLVWPAVGTFLGALVVVVAIVWPDVRSAAIDRAAAGPLVEALKGGTPAAAVIFTQPQVYDRLAWIVRPRQSVLLAEPKYLEWTGDYSLNARLSSALRDAPEVTVVTDTTDTDSGLVPAINRWLEAHYGRRPDLTLGQIQLSDFRASERAAEKPLDTRFGSQLELRGFSPSTLTARPGQPLAVTLHWFAPTRIDRDYTISVQLLNPNGSLAAQHDAMPVDNSFPTSTWTAGLDVYDRIELPLPPGLQPGTYSLIV